MSVNSSLSLNASDASYALVICFSSTNGTIGLFTFAVVHILLLLPLSAAVIYVGFRDWRRQRSTSSNTEMSHVDLVTYHTIAIEIFGLLGSTNYWFGIYFKDPMMVMAGFHVFSMIFPGQTLFHCLTCSERYLAVIHPITYLRLKNGSKIRYINIGAVWFCSFGWVAVMSLSYPDFPTLAFFILCSLSLILSCFCSLSILHALTRPPPGEGGRDRERADQSKQRAFNTTMAIMATLLLRFAGIMICLIMYMKLLKDHGVACVVIKNLFWFCIPSSLVLPVLFLLRRGKHTFNTKSG